MCNDIKFCPVTNQLMNLKYLIFDEILLLNRNFISNEIFFNQLYTLLFYLFKKIKQKSCGSQIVYLEYNFSKFRKNCLIQVECNLISRVVISNTIPELFNLK